MSNVWRVSATIDEADHFAYDEVFSALDAGIDLSQKEGKWLWTAYVEDIHTRDSLEDLLAILNDMTGKKADTTIESIPETDWKEKLKQSFPPLEVGSFFIHSFDEKTPEGLIDLKIPAGLAFGTGEHPTTASCLRIYTELAEENTFQTVLDMGCGSAILAMAAAKKQSSACLAVDIDPESVETATDNIDMNGCAEDVFCLCGDGFKTPEVQDKQPFDLIFANILAMPLIEMAPALAAVLAESGTAILSGFTTDQQEKVVQAYKNQGLEVIAETSEQEWVAVAVSSVKN